MEKGEKSLVCLLSTNTVVSSVKSQNFQLNFADEYVFNLAATIWGTKNKNHESYWWFLEWLEANNEQRRRIHCFKIGWYWKAKNGSKIT